MKDETQVHPISHAGCIKFIAGVEALLESSGIRDRNIWEAKILKEWSEEMIRNTCGTYHIQYVEPARSWWIQFVRRLGWSA